MISPDLQKKIIDIYEQYDEYADPLIMLIKRYNIKNCLIMNEVRNFNQHLACCFIGEEDESVLEKEISKANRHLDRVIKDCFKVLIFVLDQDIQKRSIEWREYNFFAIFNGADFLKEYSSKLRTAQEYNFKARYLEKSMDENTIDMYSRCFSEYQKLNDWIYSDDSKRLFDALISIKKIKSKHKKIETALNLLLPVAIYFILNLIFHFLR